MRRCPVRHAPCGTGSGSCDDGLRRRTAVATAQYRNTKPADGGKKDEALEKARKAAAGKFQPKAPPRLVHSR